MSEKSIHEKMREFINQRYPKFSRGDIWINNTGYKVEILDYGFDSVWLLYLENGNRVAWEYKPFLEQYWFYAKKEQEEEG